MNKDNILAWISVVVISGMLFSTISYIGYLDYYKSIIIETIKGRSYQEYAKQQLPPF